MNVKFNGKEIEVNNKTSLKEVLEDQASLQGFNLEASVAAVNLQFVHKEDYGQYQVESGDDIELLTAVVGG